jgi:hypothetical protein
MGKTYRANQESGKKYEMHEQSNSKKYFFNDINNLRVLDNLTSFLDESGLEGCVIGGNAVSANYINFIQQKIRNFDLYDYNKNIKNFSRETADIDIVINGQKPDNFEELILKYFGKTDFKTGKSNELDLTINNETPYLSFHFIEKNKDSQSKYFGNFVENAKDLSFISNKKTYNCRAADPLDLVIMKLKSCDERVTESKKENDLFDLNILININKYTVSQIKNRAMEIGYNESYENKIKKSLFSYVNFVIKNHNWETARQKLEMTFGNAGNSGEIINNLFSYSQKL